MRLQTFYLSLPHAKKNSLKKPSDLFALPWDAKPVINIDPKDYTEEAFRELDKRYANIKKLPKRATVTPQR